ncbi:hypothetical protein D3C76_1275950 [compost metagenome]
MFGSGEELGVGRLQPGEVQLAVLGRVAHQEHPQLHHVTQAQALAVQRRLDLVQHRAGLGFGIAIRGNGLRWGLGVGNVRQGAADECQRGAGRYSDQL